jgi:uncharacterized glyoxalase superfamily protein PhnB
VAEHSRNWNLYLRDSSDGAEVTDPLKEQFFGTYGTLNDKFGVRWMFQTDKKS